MMETFVTNPDIFMVQSRLYSPAYSGPGKWIIFNPCTRRAFLAVGKDTLPDIVPLLLRASEKPISIDDIQHIGMSSTADQLSRLVQNALLLPSSEATITRMLNFTQRYHIANYNYPFQDYMDPNWRDLDRKQMGQYGRMWLPPPTMTQREGVYYQLPIVEANDLQFEHGKVLSLRELTTILRFVFGPIDEIQAEFGPWLRKTSPSGGARHPTEGIILLPREYDHIPAGIYTYDVQRHGLVASYEEYPLSLLNSLDQEMIGFMIRSRIERPMWRYRDIRSFRPVLLDAGHVVETLSLLLGLKGFATDLRTPVISESDNFSWVEEPEVALILSGPEENLAKGYAQELPTSNLEKILKEPSLTHLTNPDLYMTFDRGQLIAHILWPELKNISLSLDDFLVLTHCLPSLRGDRDTTRDGITASLKNSSNSHLDMLYESHALLPTLLGEKFYSRLDMWIHYGWYLTFLAHTEIRASIQKSSSYSISTPYITSSPRTFSEKDLIASLFNRKTTRKFSSQSITKEQLDMILIEASQPLGGEKQKPIRIFVAALNVDTLETSGLYEWDFKHYQLVSQHKQLTAQDIRTMTIGQECAGAGAATIWIMRRLDFESPAHYELDILELGRMGQRICLAATTENLGVFLTPAVSDDTTYQALEVKYPLESILYTFTLGHRWK